MSRAAVPLASSALPRHCSFHCNRIGLIKFTVTIDVTPWQTPSRRSSIFLRALFEREHRWERIQAIESFKCTSWTLSSFFTVYESMHKARQEGWVGRSLLKGLIHVSAAQSFALLYDLLEFIQICRAVGLGFVVMGFIGYFVKLIHIPINHVVSH